MTTVNGGLQGLALNERPSKDLVCVEDYDISKRSTEQKLSSLDMNMLRTIWQPLDFVFIFSVDVDTADV